MTETLAWRVEAVDADQRLDRFVTARVDAARHQVSRWIAEGRVQVDDRPGKAGERLRPGTTITCAPPSADADPRIEPEEGPVTVLYEDAWVTVVDKPAGLVVHPGAGRDHGTLVHRLLHRDPTLAGVGGPGRPGIVHRLDQDTTGVMVIARTTGAYQALARAFAERAVAKHYVAIVYGRPRAATGLIDQPIGRDPRDRKRMAVRPGGRPARTGYRTRASDAGLSILDLDLETGRTHQIRVHAKAIGHPLVGDPTYGEARWRALPPTVRRRLRDFPRPALHARRLSLPHPETGETLTVDAPVPEDLLTLWTGVTGVPWRRQTSCSSGL